RLFDDVGAHDHAGAAAERRVVDGLVPVCGEIADIDGGIGPELFLQRLARQRLPERAGEHLGKQGQQVDVPAVHSRIPSGSSTVTALAAMSTASTFSF